MPPTSSSERQHKVTLLLDLDETVMTAFLEEDFNTASASIVELRDYLHHHKLIHYRQNIGDTPIKHRGCHIYIINPDRLKKMIEAIYTEGDDIIIFTAGAWNKALLSLIATACDLSETAAASFSESILLNIHHDSEQLGLPLDIIRHMNKADRLHRLFRPMPELANRHFVLLDDNLAHLDACKRIPFISTVHAATDKDDLGFYEVTLDCMRRARDPSTPTSQLLNENDSPPNQPLGEQSLGSNGNAASAASSSSAASM